MKKKDIIKKLERENEKLEDQVHALKISRSAHREIAGRMEREVQMLNDDLAFVHKERDAFKEDYARYEAAARKVRELFNIETILVPNALEDELAGGEHPHAGCTFVQRIAEFPKWESNGEPRLPNVGEMIHVEIS